MIRRPQPPATNEPASPSKLAPSSSSSSYSSSSSLSTPPAPQTAEKPSVAQEFTYSSSYQPSVATTYTSSTRTPAESHRLDSGWSFWYNCSYQSRNSHNGDNFSPQLIGNVLDIETFWGFFNHLVPMTHLSLNSSYLFFRSQIKPQWEDPANRKGWKMTITTRLEQSDQCWETMLVLLISETLASWSEICGITASRRRDHGRIVVWLRSSFDSSETRSSFERQVREKLTADLEIEFATHEETVNHGGPRDQAPGNRAK
eukprot:TRINITY_DN7391_c0_g8_i1.p1 TRINITY_DN7391_c0_g8~~TRINITY_DN7391_c0_g8_i1.p1  ORF type:complete len:258 (+),score=55.64 TRINITY_DN7391_c0_g8_i1:475-1248(+)